jgi:phage terminase large subunit
LSRILRIETAPAFEPLLAPARDKGAHGGRGSGKSHFFASLMVEDCLAEPGESGEGLRAVCLREVQQDLKESAKLLIEDKIQKFGLGPADGFKIFKDRIETPKDGIVIFKGMNNYNSDSIKSLEHFKRAWWEEAHTATQASIALLRPTLRDEGSQLWWSWNRSRKVDPVDVMLTGQAKPTGAAVVNANWRDNPWFPAVLEQERQDCLNNNPDQYDHIWEGGYVTVVDGAYFAKQLAQARGEGRIGRVPADPLMTIRLFTDIGGTGARADAFSMWAAQFIGREIRVLNYYEAVGQEIGTHLGWMRQQGYTPERAQVWLPHDGRQHDKVYRVSYESAFMEAGYPTTVVDRGNPGERIEAVRRRFPAIWFNEATTKGGLDALGWYHEKKDDERGIGLGPEHDWASHGADSFGQMCVVYELPKAKEKPLKLPQLGIA